jgi:glycosyltransferase involved in cell wall biosynthesis
MSENLYHKKVLIFIVAYNAEKTLQDVLDRIPEEIFKYQVEVLVIDDSSKDKTFNVGIKYHKEKNIPLKVLYNPKNQGYGGNQKLGYFYAIKNKFDVVVLLHGDGQYAPQELPRLIKPLLNNEADAVFGSRMLEKKAARLGGMPLYKWIGNKILTNFQNSVLKVKLSEFHSGYRAYSVKALKQIPFHKNTNDFHFDTEIIIQLLLKKLLIKEIPIETYYGDEICHVNGIKYAFHVFKSTLLAKSFQMGFFYNSVYDVSENNIHYDLKLGYTSSHSLIIDEINPGSKILDIGCGQGLLGNELKKKTCYVEGADQYPLEADQVQNLDKFTLLNLDDIEKVSNMINADCYDYIIMSDIIEHLKYPDLLLESIKNNAVEKQPIVVITTPNIAFFFIRLQLIMGNFNYGKMGILDLTHTRLFTFYSIKALLEQAGYQIQYDKGIPVPFPKAIGDKFISRGLLIINKWLIRIWKQVFSYQIMIVARPLPTIETLLNLTLRKSKELQKQFEGMAE